VELARIVNDFALGVQIADGQCRPARSHNGLRQFSQGIGPYPEAQALRLVYEALGARFPEKYSGVQYSVAFPNAPRQKCDLLVPADGKGWVVEVKLLRFLGDNGKQNGNMLMHILSPYPFDRSALSDCVKLANSKFEYRMAVLIYGFDHDSWPLDPAIEAFETLASKRVKLGCRNEATFTDLVHPVHSQGRVFAWEVEPERG